MRDDHNRAIPVAQVCFQPFYGVDVKVVAGFVQKENVRVFQQDASQAGARALTAGKLLKRTLVIRFVKTETGEGLLDAVIEGVATPDVKLVLQPAIPGQNFRLTGWVLHLKL